MDKHHSPVEGEYTPLNPDILEYNSTNSKKNNVGKRRDKHKNKNNKVKKNRRKHSRQARSTDRKPKRDGRNKIDNRLVDPNTLKFAIPKKSKDSKHCVLQPYGSAVYQNLEREFNKNLKGLTSEGTKPLKKFVKSLLNVLSANDKRTQRIEAELAGLSSLLQNNDNIDIENDTI